MKNYILFFALLLQSAASQAQATFTIMDGASAANTHVLTNFNNQYGLQEYIYLQSEIGHAGTISAVQFKSNIAFTANNIDIYMVEKNKNSFTGISDWVKPTADGMTKVVNNQNISFINGWTTITLNTAFSYSNTNSLIILIDYNGNSQLGTNKQFHYVQKSSTRHLFRGSLSNVDPNNPGLSDCCSSEQQQVSNLTLTFSCNSLSANAGPDKNTCAGGSVTLGNSTVASGGTTPYAYNWSPSVGLSSATAARPGASPSVTTTYSVFVTDANGCSSTDAMVLTINAIPTANAGSDQAICIGDAVSIGSASVSGNTYSWIPSGGLNSTTGSSPNASPSSGTTYTVTVTSSAGCTSIDDVAITVNSRPPADAGIDQAICIGNSANIGSSSVSGVTYSWSPATGLSSITGSNPAAGPSSTTNYTVTATGTNGCTKTDVVVVTVYTLPTANAGVDQSICIGDSASIGSTAVSGNTYSWSPAAGLSSVTGSNPKASPTATTNYTVTVNSATGCVKTDDVTVNVLSRPIAEAGVDLTICRGDNISIGSASVSGNTYSWNPSSGLDNAAIANPSANPMSTSSYTVTVTGSNGCSNTDGIIISVNSMASFTLLPTAVTCNGGNDGSATIDNIDGNSPFTYLWSSGATSIAASSLSAGTYSMTVTDANGCSNRHTTTVTQPLALTIPVTISDYSGYGVSVYGASDGFIHPNPNGGTPSYSYSWSTGETLQNATSLNAGIYSLAVTDANNCTVTATYTLTEPALLVVDEISSPILNGGFNLSCHGGSDGSIHLEVHGAVPPFTFQWSNGAFTQDVSGLTAGYYMVRIFDNNGAEIDTNITLTQPPAIATVITPSYYPNDFNISTMGGSDGSLDATATGGTAAYSYSWVNENNGSTIGITSSVTGLTAGLYSLTVTDANGCAADNSKWLFQPAYGGGWDLKGNLATDADSNYLGTKDSSDLVIKTDGEERVRIDADGGVTIKSLETTDTIMRMAVIDPTGKLLSFDADGPSLPIPPNPIHCNVTSSHWLMDLCIPGRQNNTFHYPLSGNVAIGSLGVPAGIKLAVTGNQYITGSLGIGVDPGTASYVGNATPYKLMVAGKLGAEEIYTTMHTAGWPDYVFHKDYKLRSLEDVKEFINKNKHLPDMPSASEIEANGRVNVGEIQTKTLKQLEELYLQVIKLNDKVNELEQKNAQLEKKIGKVK